MLRVKPCEKEPTKFFVESNSLQCVIPECGKLFNRRLRPDLRVGGACPKCGGQLDVRFHTVNLEAYSFNGSCTCEFFTYTLAKELSRLSPQQIMEKDELLTCHHIRAAQKFSYQLTLRCHVKFDKTRNYEQ